MGKAATTQTLSYPLRLPDEVQEDALRLLDVSREVINQTVTALWDRLDEFATRTNRYAYKQVEDMMAPPQAHGHRQWRCEAEQAGRILRGQAARKHQFALILPLLEQGMILPKTEKRRAGKNRQAIKQAVAELREANADGGSAVELQSLIEQACNFYLANGCFPSTYEEMQPTPVLSDELFAAFYRNDQEASQELLRRAEIHKDDLKMAMDFICGVLGLRFHQQFLQELLNENFVAFQNEQRAYNHAGSAGQLLDSVQLNQPGLDTISQMFPELGKMEVKEAQKRGKISGWLILAWSEQDIIAKFNALFIPLEMILDGVKGTLSEDLSAHIQALQDFIQTQGGDDTERLSNSLKELTDKIRPSLTDRFNSFADQAKMPGYESDKAALKQFNRIRNGLLHRGDPNVRIHVPVGEEVQALEDLTERYVNFYLFGDTNVYQSSFLPRPKST